MCFCPNFMTRPSQWKEIMPYHANRCVTSLMNTPSATLLLALCIKFFEKLLIPFKFAFEALIIFACLLNEIHWTDNLQWRHLWRNNVCCDVTICVNIRVNSFWNKIENKKFLSQGPLSFIGRQNKYIDRVRLNYQT